MFIHKFVYEIVGSTSIKELALEEIKSIYIATIQKDIHNNVIKVLRCNNILCIQAPLYVGLEISRRAAFIKYAGLVLDSGNLRHLLSLPIKRSRVTTPYSFSINILSSKINQKKTINDTIKAIGHYISHGYVNIRNPYFKIDVLNLDNEPIMVLRLPIGRTSVSKRSPFFRAYAPPATMESFLSRALVNLSRTRIGDVFLDPFCGSGSLLFEAYNIGAYPIGLEIHPKGAYGSLFNARKLNTDISIVLGDATRMPFPDASIDAIATDPPYGRSASTFKLVLRELYVKFFIDSSRVLKRKRHMAICYPRKLSDVPSIASQYNFEEIFRCEMKIHKGLTRLISVFRLI